MKIRFATILIILMAAALQGNAQKTTTPTQAEQDVRNLERSWLDAYEKRDAASMSAIVADDFTITFPDGSVQTKQQVVDSIKQPGGPAMKFRTENVQSRVYGDTVILIGLVMSEWKQGEQLMTDRSRYTDT
jgi:ketosteroid isomerase-like protein